MLYKIIGFACTRLLIWAYKKGYKKYFVPMGESLELMNTVVDAMSDGKLTAQEIRNIIMEAKDVSVAMKKIR